MSMTVWGFFQTLEKLCHIWKTSDYAQLFELMISNNWRDLNECMQICEPMWIRKKNTFTQFLIFKVIADVCCTIIPGRRKVKRNHSKYKITMTYIPTMSACKLITITVVLNMLIYNSHLLRTTPPSSPSSPVLHKHECLGGKHLQWAIIWEFLLFIKASELIKISTFIHVPLPQGVWKLATAGQ